MAASSLLVATAPRLVAAAPTPTPGPLPTGLENKSDEKTNGPTTAQFLNFDWKPIDFHSPAVAQDSWPKLWPQGGSASVLLDYKGNWQLNSSFPGDSELKDPCWVSVHFALKGMTVPTGLLITKVYKVEKGGGSGSKSGNGDPIIADLWKLIVKGHKYTWYAHVHRIPPQNPPPPPPEPQGSSSGGGGGCLSSVSGAIGAFFTGGASCL